MKAAIPIRIVQWEDYMIDMRTPNDLMLLYCINSYKSLNFCKGEEIYLFVFTSEHVSLRVRLDSNFSSKA